MINLLYPSSMSGYAEKPEIQIDREVLEIYSEILLCDQPENKTAIKTDFQKNEMISS